MARPEIDDDDDDDNAVIRMMLCFSCKMKWKGGWQLCN